MAIYEIVTDVMYPVLPSVTLGILHACANTAILACTAVSDEISSHLDYKNHTAKDDIFNDVI